LKTIGFGSKVKLPVQEIGYRL